MDTEGPISVLDRRPRSSSRDRIIADRITRQRSPGPAYLHQRGRRVPSHDGSLVDDDAPEVIYRISQPYRTSFSAKHSVTWGKPDRSRSLSPTTSLRSDASYASAPPVFSIYSDKRRPRGRSKSPKRVTYNSRVIVRHSDTEDSMFTELSSHEYDDDDTPQRPIRSPFSRSLISPRYNEFSQLSPVHSHSATPTYHERRPRVRDVTNIGSSSGSDQCNTSRDSGLDYSAELKDLSDQITKMQWSPRQHRTGRTRPPPMSSPTHQYHYRHSPPMPSSSGPSPHGILKDSQNSRSAQKEYRTGVISTGNGILNEGVSIGSASRGSRSGPQSPGIPSRDSPPSSNRDKENDPMGSPTTVDGGGSPRHSPELISRDYEHERPFSYSRALKGDYGEDIQKLAKEGLAEAQQHEHVHSGSDSRTVNGGLSINTGNGSARGDNKKFHQVDDIGNTSPADTSQDTSPGRGSPVESGRLTPSKRSKSLSITNFFKRVSPHFGRRRSKERHNNKKANSAEGSAQSLTNNSDPDTDPDSPDNHTSREKPGKFSRSHVRQSLMKLVGRSKKKQKGQPPPDDPIPIPSHYTIEPQDPTSSDEVDEIANGYIINSKENIGNSNGKTSFDTTTNRIMKSIEQNKVAEQDIYRRFKDRHSPRGGQDLAATTSPTTLTTYTATATCMTRPELLSQTTHSPMQPTTPGNDSSRMSGSFHRMEFFTESDINAILRPHLNKPSDSKPSDYETYDNVDNISPSRVGPPTSLDVMPSRRKNLLQTSVMSSMSGDESIGECSLDPNLTASEPSLVSGFSQSAVSKQVVLPRSLVSSAEGRLPTELESVRLRKTQHREGQSNKENFVPHTSPTAKARSDPPSPVDPNHKPSYLKLSCAVSGYGRYCRYSTYKDVNKRSPYSSQSSLRSDYSSPDPSIMPAERRSGDESTPEHKNRLSPAGWSKSYSRTNGQAGSPTIAVNGHAQKYPTGDTAKDGEYFLQHTQFEEDRIRGLSLRTEAHMRSNELPEEASGRIRAATGKANLLVTKKFAQFRELCQNHMQPSPEERETKWEDLQGFWDMVKIQIDNVDDMFAEIELMKHNGWQEVTKLPSRRSSASSSPKSGSISQASTPAATPSHTPGSKRKNLKPGSNKDTPESSPERTHKARQAAKARDEARKKMLAEKRAAMKQASTEAANGEPEVEIYLPEPPKK